MTDLKIVFLKKHNINYVGLDFKQVFLNDGNYCFTYMYMGETVTVTINNKKTKTEFSLGKRKRTRVDLAIIEILKKNTVDAFIALS